MSRQKVFSKVISFLKKKKTQFRKFALKKYKFFVEAVRKRISGGAEDEPTVVVNC